MFFSKILEGVFIESIDRKDVSAGLATLQDISKAGVDVSVFMKLVLHKVRSILLLRYAKNLKKVVEEQFGKEDIAFLEKIGERKGSNINSRSLSAMLSAYAQLGVAHIPTLPVELALMELLESEG